MADHAIAGRAGQERAVSGPAVGPAVRSEVRQRILVLGASGFIGGRIVSALAGSNWAQPVAATHRSPGRFGAGAETVRLDARQADELARALEGASAVVNGVAGDDAAIIACAQSLFEACARQARPPRIVNLSSMAAYGSSTGTVDESAPLRGDWDDYSAAKRDVEAMARRYRDIVHLRPGIVYGPGSPIWSGRIGRWLEQGRLGDLGEAGAGFCNLVHVDDVVLAVERALRTPGIEGEAFNLSLPEPPTWNEYFRRYAAALETPCPRIAPWRLQLELGVIAPPLKLAEIAAGKLRLRWQPPAPIRPWLLRLCRHPLKMDVRKAERVLGLQWTPLDPGLRATAQWLRESRTGATAAARTGAAAITAADPVPAAPSIAAWKRPEPREPR
jgi:nucleoside-diphosphate-sugar epimerase